MNDETPAKVEHWPGEIQTLSGGTRNTVRLSRPWQTPMKIDTRTCPFCAEERPGADRSLVVSVDDSGWKVRKNRRTPYDFHRLLLPKDCFHQDALRSLGGQSGIEHALRLASSVIGEGVSAGQQVPEHLFLTVHVGYAAGQTEGHLHWHLLEPGSTPCLSEPDLDDLAESPNILWLNGEFLTMCGGCVAGQCFIIPQKRLLSGETAEEEMHRGDRRRRLSNDSVVTLAETTNTLIALGNSKFRSEQGLPPDFGLGFRFSGRELVYGMYVPVLGKPGMTEYMGLHECTPLTLPWTHETTANFLMT